MSGENNYEVHVALTGLNEAVSQLESFEARVATLGKGGTPVDASVVNQIATAKADLLNLRGAAAATLAGIREDLSKGIAPNTNLTAAVTDSVKQSLQVVNQLGEQLKKSLDLKATFNPSELTALTNGVRTAIVSGGQSGLKQLRAEFNAFGKEMGLSTGLVGPVTNGRGANLVFDRAVSSVPPVDFGPGRTSQEMAAAQREAERALRDFARSVDRAVNEIRAEGGLVRQVRETSTAVFQGHPVDAGKREIADIVNLTRAAQQSAEQTASLYRGVGGQFAEYIATLKVGDKGILPLSSFSTDEERAEEFSRVGRTNTLLEFEPGARGFDTSGHTARDVNGDELRFGHEKEVIAGGGFEVTKKLYDAEREVVVVTLRQIQDTKTLGDTVRVVNNEFKALSKTLGTPAEKLTEAQRAQREAFKSEVAAAKGETVAPQPQGPASLRPDPSRISSLLGSAAGAYNPEDEKYLREFAKGILKEQSVRKAVEHPFRSYAPPSHQDEILAELERRGVVGPAQSGPGDLSGNLSRAVLLPKKTDVDEAISGRFATPEEMVTVYRGSHEPFDPSRVNGEGVRVTTDRSYAEEYGGKQNLYSTQIPKSMFEVSPFTDEALPHARLSREDLAKYPLTPVVENGRSGGIPTASSEEAVAGAKAYAEAQQAAARQAREDIEADKRSVAYLAEVQARLAAAITERANHEREALGYDPNTPDRRSRRGEPPIGPLTQEQQESRDRRVANATERTAEAERILRDATENLARQRAAAARSGAPIDLSDFDHPHSGGGFGGNGNGSNGNGTGGNGSGGPGGGGHFFSSDFPSDGGLTPEEAALAVRQRIQGAARTSAGQDAPFYLPHVTGEDQSPFFQVLRGKKGETDTLSRIEDPVRVQQLAAGIGLDEPTTVAGRKRLQQATEKLIQAQNEEAVALLENAGILKKQSALYSRDENGTFIRRKGAGAGTPVSPGDDTYEQDIQAARQAAATTARKEEIAREKAKKIDETSTLGGTFLGGFTSKGFENPGQGILPALVGTAGVLARYALDGAAFGAVTLAIKGTLEETEEYQKALIELNEAAQATHAGQIDLGGAFSEGAKYGLDQATAIQLGTAGIRNYATEIENGANATDIFTESVKQAGINAIITGQKAAEAQKQLLSITNEFGTGSQGQGRVSDAVFNAAQRFNASPAEIQKSLVENGDLAQVAGFDQERLAATSAAIIGQGASPTGLSRLLARGGNAQFQGALSSLGVTNTGNVSDELDKAAEAYSKLNNAQKAAFAEQSGGARSAAILIALLKEQRAINESVSESYTEGGKAAQAALDIQNTAAGQIKQFFTELKNLGSELGKSGVADILALLFEVIKTGLGAVDTLVAGFNKLTDFAGPFKDIVITAGELFLVLRAIAGLSAAGTIIGGFGAIGKKIRNKEGNGGGEEAAIPTAAKGAAGEIEGAGATLAASIEEAAARIRAAAGVAAEEVVAGGEEIGAAETTVAGEVAAGGAEIAGAETVASTEIAAGGLRGLLAGLGARLGFSGAALGGLGLAAGAGVAVAADGLFAYKAGKNYQGQLDARDEARNAGSSGTGNADDLAEEARKASSAAQKSRASSGGFLGTVENAIGKGEGYGSTGEDAKHADATAAELAREADRQKEAESKFKDRLGLAGNFNLNAPDFSKGVTDLQSQGKNATQIGQAELSFLDDYLARQNSSKSYLSTGQGEILAGKVANTTSSNLRTRATDIVSQGSDSPEDAATQRAARKVSDFNKKQQQAVNDAINDSTKEFIESNNLEGQDLSKLPQGTLSKLKQQNVEALKQSLKKQGLSDKDIEALDKSGTLNREAGAGIGANAFNINDKSGTPLTQAQITDAIKNSSATAKGIGTAAGVQDVLTQGVNSNQQGADLKAQQTYLQSLRDKLLSSNPDADVSILDEQLNQLKIDLANATGTQAKAMAKYAADLLSPLDVSGRLNAQLKGVQEAAKTDTGQALRDDLAQIAQLGFQQTTRANVTAPTAAEALTLDPRSITSAPKLALDNAERELADAQAQHADQATLDQKSQAVRQARLAYNQAVTQDANATEAANVVLGDKVGELKAKYDGLIAQARNQTGGQAAQTLRDAQQVLIDEANTQADILGKIATSNLDPRNKIGALRVQLNTLRSKVFAPGDVGGRADNVTQQKAIEQQIRDQTNAQNAAIANSRFDQRDTTGLARQAVKNAKTNLDAQLPGTKEYADALIAYKNAQITYNTAVRSVADAAEESHVFSGDALGEARSKLDAANRALAAALKGTTAYYQALRAQKDAQIAYAAEVDAAKDVVRELSGDRTDPIFNAAEDLRKAQEKLARDKKLGAPKDIIDKDNLDVQDKQQNLQKTALDRQMSLMATQRQLNQISVAQYVSYLKGQDTALRAQLAATKVGSEGYAQLIDEINSVDVALQSAMQQGSGQFNLGDIKLPTVYQVRTQLGSDPQHDPTVIAAPVNIITTAVNQLATPAAQAARNVDQVTKAMNDLAQASAAASAAVSRGSTNTSVTINGADFAKVIAYINSLLGPQATGARTATSSRKV